MTNDTAIMEHQFELYYGMEWDTPQLRNERQGWAAAWRAARKIPASPAPANAGQQGGDREATNDTAA